MSGILPSASNHPVWSPIAGEIHAVIWDRVGLEVVQGFVREWASNWLKKFNSAESSQQESLARVRQQLHYPDYETLPLIADNLPYDRQMQQAIDAIKDWQPWLPELPLPPSPHRPRSLAEKWASLAALHDVYDLTGDTVLPWPLPEDDLDMVAFTEWFRGEAGAYQLLMRKAFELQPDCKSAIRRWLTDVSKDTLPKESTDLSQLRDLIEAAVASGAKSRARGGAVDEEKPKNKVEKLNKTEKKFLNLLEDYHNWQQSQFELTGKKRFNEAGWLEAQDKWPKRSKNFFTEMDRDRDSYSDFDGSILLSQLLDNARKVRLKYYGDGETKKPILFNPPFRRNKEVLPK